MLKRSSAVLVDTLPTAERERGIIAPELFQPLTSIQRAALDLYRRGLNVFPVPRPPEARAYSRANSKDETSKPAYLVKPFYATRLHICTPECRRRYLETGRRCIPEGATFESLFEVASIAAMMGRTSGNLLDIDCDSERAYHHVGQALQARGAGYWSYFSSRGGGYLMRLAEGEAANLPECTIPDVQVWGSGHYCILPPSVHHTGIIYQWDNVDPRAALPVGEPPPLVYLDQLDFLGVTLAKSKRKPPELYGLPEWTICLSARNRRILASTSERGSRNIDLTKPAYDLAAAIKRGDVGYQEVDQLINDFCRRCGYSVSDAQGMLKSALHKRGLMGAKEYYDALPVEKPFERALRLAASFDWRSCGHSAQADRAVFLACCERARLENSDIFRAAAREIAELANVTAKTASVSLRRLCATTSKRPALLRLYENDDNRVQANAYKFTLPEEPKGEGTTYYSISTCKSSVVSCPSNISPLQDVFSTHPVALRVWQYLQGNSGTAAAIAKATNQHSKSVRRALRWLVGSELVTFSQAEGVYIGEQKTTAELETLSAVLGTFGKAEKRKHEHQRERERRANMLMARERARWLSLYHLGKDSN